MRIEQTFTIARPPESVFDYITDPANLRAWQTTKTRVEAVSQGPPRQGFRVREWTKPPGAKEFEQLVEFSEFERPNRLSVHVVEGPYPVDGTWVLSDVDGGTQVHFVAEGRLQGMLRFAEPVFSRVLGRQFAKYHEALRRNVESAG
jgi:uncharacterized protein YndB with AHSA1/START domain